VTACETWLPVPVAGYEALYEVSDLGRVRSLDRTVTDRNQWGPCLRTQRGRVLKPRLNLRQELTVSLSRHGVIRDCRIHRLVLEAFAGPCPPGMEALHGPAGKLDNNLANLRWGTRAENQADRLRDGTSNHGERNSQHRLTGEAAAEIRRRYAAGETQRTLAAAFGVGRMTVSDIVRGKSWQHVPAAEEAA